MYFIEAEIIMWLTCLGIKDVKQHCRSKLFSSGLLYLKLEPSWNNRPGSELVFKLISLLTDAAAGKAHGFYFCLLHQRLIRWTVRWHVNGALRRRSRAEEVLSAVPFNTKRQLLCRGCLVLLLYGSVRQESLSDLGLNERRWLLTQSNENWLTLLPLSQW